MGDAGESPRPGAPLRERMRRWNVVGAVREPPLHYAGQPTLDVNSQHTSVALDSSPSAQNDIPQSQRAGYSKASFPRNTLALLLI